jgi:8-oxo-dGTP pyrophosphatase MutT (NUDIX family)
MKILKSENNLSYVPLPNKAKWISSSYKELSLDLVTSCFCIVKYKDNYVFTKHVSRGIEIAGGHREDESILDCVNREISEELGVKNLIDVKYLCHQEIEILVPKIKDYQYPYPKSCQIMFFAKTDSLEEFEKCFDSLGRVLVKTDEIKKHPIYEPWSFVFDLIVNF